MGYFYKIYKSDFFCILDDVQFSRRSFINRSQFIDKNNNISYINIPVLNKNKYFQKINETKIYLDIRWRDKILNKIYFNYSNTRYFKDIFFNIERILNQNKLFLYEINLDLISYFCHYLEIETKFFFSSKLNIREKKDNRIIEIGKILKSKNYISGLGASKYNYDLSFKNAGIKIEYIDIKKKLGMENCTVEELVNKTSLLSNIFKYGKSTIEFFL